MRDLSVDSSSHTTGTDAPLDWLKREFARVLQEDRQRTQRGELLPEQIVAQRVCQRFRDYWGGDRLYIGKRRTARERAELRSLILDDWTMHQMTLQQLSDKYGVSRSECGRIVQPARVPNSPVSGT